MAINISNNKNRDAVVALEPVHDKREIRYEDPGGKAVHSQRVLKSDTEHDLEVVQGKRKNLNSVAKRLLEEDPEIDIELFGLFLSDTSRVYVTSKGIAHLVEEFEILKKPDGTVRERRPRRKLPQNLNTDIPVRWTGKFIKKEEAAHRFVFTGKRQLMHINGLTFDFLYEMAKELDRRKAFLLLKGGEKGTDPIVMTRGGKSYNGFLEGRVKGDTYCLVLHLSNMELKKPGIANDGSD